MSSETAVKSEKKKKKKEKKNTEKQEKEKGKVDVYVCALRDACAVVTREG